MKILLRIELHLSSTLFFDLASSHVDGLCFGAQPTLADTNHMCAVNTNMTRSVGDAFYTNSSSRHNTLQLFKNLPYDREVSLHSNHNVQPHDTERCSAEWHTSEQFRNAPQYAI